MTRLLIAFTLISGLCGCVVAPPGYGYGYGYPAPAYYGYAPGYYYGPPVSVGISGRFHIR
jgi:hypothetical protein